MKLLPTINTNIDCKVMCSDLSRLKIIQQLTSCDAHYAITFISLLFHTTNICLFMKKCIFNYIPLLCMRKCTFTKEKQHDIYFQ